MRRCHVCGTRCPTAARRRRRRCGESASSASMGRGDPFGVARREPAGTEGRRARSRVGGKGCRGGEVVRHGPRSPAGALLAQAREVASGNGGLVAWSLISRPLSFAAGPGCRRPSSVHPQQEWDTTRRTAVTRQLDDDPLLRRPPMNACVRLPVQRWPAPRRAWPAAAAGACHPWPTCANRACVPRPPAA